MNRKRDFSEDDELYVETLLIFFMVNFESTENVWHDVRSKVGGRRKTEKTTHVEPRQRIRKEVINAGNVFKRNNEITL